MNRWVEGVRGHVFGTRERLKVALQFETSWVFFRFNLKRKIRVETGLKASLMIDMMIDDDGNHLHLKLKPKTKLRRLFECIFQVKTKMKTSKRAVNRSLHCVAASTESVYLRTNHQLHWLGIMSLEFNSSKVIFCLK